MKQEPVVTLVVALIAAAGGLLAAFGVDVTGEQIAALSTFAVAAIGLAVFVRSRVTPSKSGRSGDAGQAEPITLLVYVIVAIILVAILLKVLDRL